jgi:predicted GTPase
MEITGYQNRLDIATKARAAAQWARENRDEEAAAAIEQEIEKLASGKFVLAIMGKAKRGKSTLINALLGRRDDVIAPIDKLPASSAISRFSWSADEKAMVTFRGGRTEVIPYGRIRDFVTEERNPENVKQVELVEISGPFPGMERDLVLVDTPGAGSLHEHHDALLHAIIPQSDAVIFLVTCRMPLDQEELELLERVKAGDIRRVFFAINKVDEIKDPRDLEDALQHNRACLQRVGIAAEKIYEVSARTAMEGKLGGSGLPPLLDEVAALFGEEKCSVLLQRFCARIRDVLRPLVESKSLELALVGKEQAQIDAETAKLQEAKATIVRSRPSVEKEFDWAWQSAVDDFERVLNTAYQRVKEEVQERIETTAMPSLSLLAKDLATVLTRTVERVLAPHTERLENALREAVAKLEIAYPLLEIVDADRARIHLKEASAPLIKSGLLISASLLAPVLPGALLGTIPYVGWLLGGATSVALLPIGFPLFGLAALTLPFAYRATKLKLKDDMRDACDKQTKIVFDRLRYERVPDLRTVGEQLKRQFLARSEKEVGQFERALARATESKRAPEDLKPMEEAVARGRQLLLGYSPAS